jgi:hypothetical protein
MLAEQIDQSIRAIQDAFPKPAGIAKHAASKAQT